MKHLTNSAIHENLIVISIQNWSQYDAAAVVWFFFVMTTYATRANNLGRISISF
jgi:hypothetical protein